MNEVFRTHVAKGPYTDLARHRGPKVTRNRLIELRETEIDVLIRRGLLRSDARNDVLPFAMRSTPTLTAHQAKRCDV